MKKAALTKKQQEQVAVLLAAGESQYNIAKTLGMSEPTFTMCVGLSGLVVTRTLMPMEEFSRLSALREETPLDETPA